MLIYSFVAHSSGFVHVYLFEVCFDKLMDIYHSSVVVFIELNDAFRIRCFKLINTERW